MPSASTIRVHHLHALINYLIFDHIEHCPPHPFNITNQSSAHDWHFFDCVVFQQQSNQIKSVFIS